MNKLEETPIGMVALKHRTRGSRSSERWLKTVRIIHSEY